MGISLACLIITSLAYSQHPEIIVPLQAIKLINGLHNQS